MKLCAGCKERPTASPGNHNCKSCSRLKRYNLSQEDYEKLKIEQDFKCAVCRISEEKLQNGFDIDHNHQTGQHRGLLCRSCNTVIGRFNDDPRKVEFQIKVKQFNRLTQEIYESILVYLQKYSNE